jgi:hypothetical protein
MAINDAKALIGIENMAKAETKVEKGAAGIAREVKKAEAELDRFAKRTAAINSTPLEKYQQQMQRLEQAVARGKITQETFARATARANDELRKTGQSQREAMGADALGQVKSFAAGYLTLSQAVNLVASAFRNAKQESKDALSSLRGLDEPRRKLVQMADSPEHLQGMLARADQAAKATGVNRATAYNVLFQAESFGFSKDYEKVLGANEVIDANAAATLAGKVTHMMGGKITGQQSINMALAAGKPSEVDAESIADSLSMAMEGGRRVGATPDETFAWVSALSAAFKSPQVAADRIKAITNRAAATPSLKSAGGMTEILHRLKALPEDERGEILKTDQETNAAYEAMLEFEGMEQRIEADVRRARLATGTDQSPLAVGQRIAGAVPQTRASLLDRRGQIDREVALEGAYATAEAQRTNAANRLVGAGASSGAGIATRYGITTANEISGGLQLGAGATTYLGAAGKAAGDALGPFGFLKALGAGINALVGKQDEFAKQVVPILQDIRDNGRTGAGRAVARDAMAPLN